jgi:diaminohydroxyphosphoribosylaminopyrimidine deaminase / 5-amino-6-(5-phosphoribosylamino)uracil reductase
LSAPTPAEVSWLDAAARIAMPWRGTTAENPTVGAIVVLPDGVMVGRGVTAKGGRPHAEPQALAMAGEAARGATLYVTLEPCAHWGNTPPCVDAVLDAGIARVVCGLPDPDPRTAGSSLDRLEGAGVSVARAHKHKPSLILHEAYISRIVRGQPFVTAKLAVSRDGMIGRGDQGNVAITGETARRWTHMQRAFSDAVMVGSETLRLDDPRLTVRLPGIERMPLRVVVSGQRDLPHDIRFWAEASIYPTAIIGVNETPSIPDASVNQIAVMGKNRRPDLREGLKALARHGINALLVEGGARLTEALLADNLVDRFQLLESDVEVGSGGVAASVRGSLPERLAELGFSEVDRAQLGCDRLRTFEKDTR